MEVTLSHILVRSVPRPGHVEPMLAAAENHKSVGHSIPFHASENFRSRVEAAGVRFVEMTGSANYDYRIPIDAQKEKNLTSDDHKLHLLKGRFAETIPDQHRRLQQVLRDTSIDLVISGSMFFGTFPMLLGPRQNRPPV